MKVHALILISISCLIVFMTQGCTCLGITIPGYCTLSSFEGKVIDTETKQPIQGAVVLAVYYGSVSSVAGSMSWVVDGQDTLTDANGEFKLPKKRYWSTENPGKPRGTIIVFKPGHGTLQHVRAEAVGENKSWPPPNKYIVYEIPKLKTDGERRSNLPGAFSFNEISYEKQKLFIHAINEEAKDVGISPYPLPKKENQK